MKIITITVILLSLSILSTLFFYQRNVNIHKATINTFKSFLISVLLVLILLFTFVIEVVIFLYKHNI